MFKRLSPDSIYMRFLEPRKALSQKEAERFAQVDYQDNMAIVATLPSSGDIVGVARYGEGFPPEPGVVDAAVIVQDDFQGRGLGTILLLRLVEYAQDQGIKAMHATVHQSNARIMRFITKSGLPTERKLAGGVWDIKVSLGDLQLPDELTRSR
jgi:GNAT superfamily N-acetyltransferase